MKQLLAIIGLLAMLATAQAQHPLLNQEAPEAAVNARKAALENEAALSAQSLPPAPEIPPQPNLGAVVGGPAGEVLQFLTVGSNWIVAPYAIYDAGTKKTGGGVAGLYRVSDFVYTGLRLDYIGKELWMPSCQVQLQAPFRIMQKVEVIPFVTAGLATPLSGKGADNGSAVGIFGAGLAMKVSKNVGVFYEVEEWTGFKGNQHRGGVYFKMGF